ncbi:Rossmann-like domain-containing protein [uncultured Sphaerochaeta sp.]|uniref:Rossmann-like domain-containing protein n=1 Tax=uncultured Sphaerochaeta sp. TaxID=886478 RepID=UPI002A0A59B9|nr:DUF364 domain-containing protein [uncultured Sphaerochaeta sp.]
MLLDNRIFTCFQQEAKESTIDEIYLGLGYSAVTLTDGRCGLCYTLLDENTSCTVNKNPQDFEKQSALPLLEKIFSTASLDRTMAIALANALNATFATSLSDAPLDLKQALHLAQGSKVAMVGYFEPIARNLANEGIEVIAYDINKEIGKEKEFYDWARTNAEALILTATSVITGSTEQVFESLGKKNIPMMLMGPSTIMRPMLYKDLGITVCAGTVPTDIPNTLKAIRNGRGTPVLHRYAKKIHAFV